MRGADVLAPPVVRPRIAGLDVAAWLAVGATAIAWLLLVGGNATSPYRVDHAGGTWASLALAAGDGTLYPPLFEGGPVASRYMPIPIIGHAAAAMGTGELLISGRLVDIAALLAIGILVAVTLRRQLVPLPLVGLAVAAPLLTEPGIENALGLRHDGIAVALQLGALLCIAEYRGVASGRLAGLLLGLAVLAKLSALWAAAAIGIWLLLRRDGRRLRATVLSAAAVLLVGVLLTQWLSEGRFLAGLLTAGMGSGAPPGFGGPLPGLPRLMEHLLVRTPTVALLLPLAAVGMASLEWRQREGIYALAVIFALAEVIVLFGDRGVFGNHLLALAVLVPMFVIANGQALPVLRPAAVAAAIAGMVFAFQLNVGDDLTATLGGEQASLGAMPALATYVDDDGAILSEDPGIEAFSGRMPTVLDPYMLRRAAAGDPASVDPLVRQIESRAFEAVVTLFPIQSDPRWYRLYHFGERVATAIDEAYVLDGYAQGYYVYRPAPGP